MKLASIINAWADTIDLLPRVIDNHLKFCDAVVVVWSSQSNNWERSPLMMEYILENPSDPRVHFVQCEPKEFLKPHQNETRKRNYGLQYAKEKHFTHYLIADGDEFYQLDDAQAVKEAFAADKQMKINGFVFRSKVYIKSPELWVSDHTLVPFIQRLHKQSEVGSNKRYPYAYKEGNAMIDPTRRPETSSHVLMMHNSFMHHMSYIRKDIELKINNSSANLRNSREAILKDQQFAAVGYRSNLYNQIINHAPNQFNL
jgi:hypothetical protein